MHLINADRQPLWSLASSVAHSNALAIQTTRIHGSSAV